MCFNKETSFVSFLFSFIISIKLLLLKQQFLGVFLLLISLMQFIEFFLWIAVNNNLHYTNLFFSFLVWLLILLQPILFSYFANEQEDPPQWAEILNWVIISLFVLSMFCYLYYSYNKKTIKSPKTCRLQWAFNNVENTGIVYFLLTFSILFSYIYSFVVTKNYDILTISIISLFLACYYSYLMNARIGKSYESFWCFLVNLVSCYVILARMKDETIQNSLF